MPSQSPRRTQQQRTRDTRDALFQASIDVINRVGYGGASTALIAEEAGVSRGAILHHFGTRAHLMAEVVRWVYREEVSEYIKMRTAESRGDRIADWPLMIWDVLSRPSAVAVTEILLATRSDPELAREVVPLQRDIERRSVEAMSDAFGWNPERDVPLQRLMVWAARGLSIERSVLGDDATLRQSITLLSRMIERLAPGGDIAELPDPS